MHSVAALPRHARLLVEALADPSACREWEPATWDTAIRAARVAQLLATLAARIEAAGLLAACPGAVRNHLQGAALQARYVRQMALVEMDHVARALAPLGVPLVLLKGASYLTGGLPVASGRLLRDVDLLVPAASLDPVERALLDAGWRYDQSLDAYDQRYYRVWSHQLPPLRRGGHPLELDVHHAILPPTGRIRPDAEALLRDCRVVGGTWRVLDPADQVVHAAVHLFQDSDCASRMRDLVDVDGLCRHYAATEAGFWPRLLDRAGRHGARAPVGYALAFARAWFGTPVDAAVAGDLEPCLSPWVIRRAGLSLPPPEPNRGRSARERRACRWMAVRAAWLRMPPRLLAFHACMKSWRALTARRRPAARTAR
jgi:hypothetical protein